jgi:hypothetical protein
MGRRIKGGKARSIVFVILSIMLAIGAFVPLLVNLALAGRFTWSLIPLGAVLMTWLILAPWFVLRRHRALISWAAAAVSAPLFLCLVESLITVKGWYLPLGLPAAAFGLSAWGGIVWVWRYSRIRIWYALSLTSLLIVLLSLVMYPLVRPYLPQPDPMERERYIVFICQCGVTVMLALIALVVHKQKVVKE